MEKLDAICMQLITVGESVKNLDKVTEGKLLTEYQQVRWKRIMGMRDILTHHYFDLDAEIVYTVCNTHIRELARVVKRMISDMDANKR